MGRREVTVSEVVRRAITQAYERLVVHESELGRGDDPESVHQARVATRRLRSDLRTFEKFVDAQWAADLRGELRWLGSELGAVRDIEVQRDRLRAHATRLPPAEAEAARRVVRRLDADRAAARSDLLVALRQDRYTQLLEEDVQGDPPAINPVVLTPVDGLEERVARLERAVAELRAAVRQ